MTRSAGSRTGEERFDNPGAPGAHVDCPTPCPRSGETRWRGATELRPLSVPEVEDGEAFRAPLGTVYAEEMSTFASPTIPSSQLTSDQLTVVAASFSSLVFFVIVIVLLSIIYRKDPQCCKHGSYQEPHTDMDIPPQYYSSRQTLVGSAFLDQTQIIDHNNAQQTGELFYVGLPASYSLPTLEAPLPRLPSYESVRKKDRQRQIHMMIADRFGLNGPIVTEPPPTYEESIRHSVELPYNILLSGLDLFPPQSFHTDTGPMDAGSAVPPAV